MTLHVEIAGRGRPLALLHGWGFDSGIWTDLAGRLARSRRVHLVDLPGHGHSRDLTFPSLDELIDEVARAIPDGTIVVGWSMGGLVAQRLARRHPRKVCALAVVAGTPCFVARKGWPHGMAPSTVEGFADDLRRDAPATLATFVRLNALGGGNSREAIRALARGLNERGGASASALDAGLDLLRTTDLRRDAVDLAVRTLVIHGARDRIVPIEAGRWLARSMPNAELMELPTAAHLPFVSDRDVVVRALESLDG
jgi:pimeloyl-[acyl-carrier protein] methyl ester esterase